MPSQSVEASINEINALGYLIQGIYQSHYTGWSVVVRSPFDWLLKTFEGPSLAVACENAAATLVKHGKVKPLTYEQRRALAVKSRVRLGKKRVRLSKARVRL